jgi:hypothetical protein
MINQLKKLVNSEVDTPDGEATLSSVYVTELGHIMAKIYYPKRGVWINHKIGDLKSLLNVVDVKLKSELTKSIQLKIKKELM